MPEQGVIQLLTTDHNAVKKLFIELEELGERAHKAKEGSSAVDEPSWESERWVSASGIRRIRQGRPTDRPADLTDGSRSRRR